MITNEVLNNLFIGYSLATNILQALGAVLGSLGVQRNVAVSIGISTDISRLYKTNLEWFS